MTKESDEFEQQITRIHQLLEGNNAEVTWNDKIPDPDNLTQPRQIDFTVRNENCFIIGECRFRKTPEDVKWIEELIGRRLSLKANGVIGVSSSGFTKGAIEKASAHGVALRNFYEITEKELLSWGKKIRLDIILSTFEELIFEFTLPKGSSLQKIYDEKGDEVHFAGFLQEIAHRIDDLNPQNNPTNFQIDATVGNLFVNGKKIEKLTVIGRLKKYNQTIEATSVSSYSEPKNSKISPLASVQKFGKAQSEIIESTSSKAGINKVSIIVDLSEITLPKNTVFYGLQTDFGKLVNLESLSLIGLEHTLKTTFGITYRPIWV